MFKAVVDASPPPFMSKNFTLSKDAFGWWRTIQYERRDLAYFHTIVDKLFRIFPPVPQVTEAHPDRCRTCAVVGNSGNLKGSHYGRLIDFHDIVIRMNHAPTKGYEEDVGAKTTHHVMYPESAVNVANTTRLVLFPFKIKDLEWLLNTFKTDENGHISQKRANKDLVMIINPAFMKYSHLEWLHKKGRYPSTGFMTLILSMQMCDEISLFGFGADSDGNWDHYFEILRNKRLRTGPHPGNEEWKVIESLVQNQKIVFFRGM